MGFIESMFKSTSTNSSQEPQIKMHESIPKARHKECKNQLKLWKTTAALYPTFNVILSDSIPHLEFYHESEGDSPFSIRILDDFNPLEGKSIEFLKEARQDFEHYDESGYQFFMGPVTFTKHFINCFSKPNAPGIQLEAIYNDLISPSFGFDWSGYNPIASDNCAKLFLNYFSICNRNDLLEKVAREAKRCDVGGFAITALWEKEPEKLDAIVSCLTNPNSNCTVNTIDKSKLSQSIISANRLDLLAKLNDPNAQKSIPLRNALFEHAKEKLNNGEDFPTEISKNFKNIAITQTDINTVQSDMKAASDAIKAAQKALDIARGKEHELQKSLNEQLSVLNEQLVEHYKNYGKPTANAAPEAPATSISIPATQPTLSPA